jgi:hypothetical protein
VSRVLLTTLFFFDITVRFIISFIFYFIYYRTPNPGPARARGRARRAPEPGSPSVLAFRFGP